eukprot:1532019-Rhodomonas_salina.1
MVVVGVRSDFKSPCKILSSSLPVTVHLNDAYRDPPGTPGTRGTRVPGYPGAQGTLVPAWYAYPGTPGY